MANDRVAVKELNLIYYIGDTLTTTMYMWMVVKIIFPFWIPIIIRSRKLFKFPNRTQIRAWGLGSESIDCSGSRSLGTFTLVLVQGL